MTRPMRLRSLLGPDFRLLSGDDATALAFIAQGGHGCISVTSNIAPGLCRNLFLACKNSQMAQAQRLASPIAQLTAALFLEASPAPLKYALSLLGLMLPKVRLPMVELTAPAKAEVAAILAQTYEGYTSFMVGDMLQPVENRVRVAAR